MSTINQAVKKNAHRLRGDMAGWETVLPAPSWAGAFGRSAETANIGLEVTLI
jgi:hypothetical protein